MEDTHVYFISPVAPTPRSEPSELQNLHMNSAVGLSKKIHKMNGRYYGMAVKALSNTSSLTLQMSGVKVSECVFM